MVGVVDEVDDAFAFSSASRSGDSWASCWGSSFETPGPPGPWWPGPWGPPRHWPAASAASSAGVSWASWAASSFEVHGCVAWAEGVLVGVVDDAAPVDATVVVVVGSEAAAAPVVPDDATVVDVVGESAAAAPAAAAVVSVVPVVPEVWAFTELRGRIVRAAIAPPVVAAVAMAATKALFLMGRRSAIAVRWHWAFPQTALRIRKQS